MFVMALKNGERKMNQFVPKLFDCMKGYTKEQFAKDVISGIIVAIIALPLSIALALASGVGPEQGIYTAIFAGFVISFLGGTMSRLPVQQLHLQRLLQELLQETECQVLRLQRLWQVYSLL